MASPPPDNQVSPENFQLFQTKAKQHARNSRISQSTAAEVDDDDDDDAEYHLSLAHESFPLEAIIYTKDSLPDTSTAAAAEGVAKAPITVNRLRLSRAAPVEFDLASIHLSSIHLSKSLVTKSPSPPIDTHSKKIDPASIHLPKSPITTRTLPPLNTNSKKVDPASIYLPESPVSGISSVSSSEQLYQLLPRVTVAAMEPTHKFTRSATSQQSFQQQTSMNQSSQDDSSTGCVPSTNKSIENPSAAYTAYIEQSAKGNGSTSGLGLQVSMPPILETHSTNPLQGRPVVNRNQSYTEPLPSASAGFPPFQSRSFNRSVSQQNMAGNNLPIHEHQPTPFATVKPKIPDNASPVADVPADLLSTPVLAMQDNLRATALATRIPRPSNIYHSNVTPRKYSFSTGMAGTGSPSSDSEDHGRSYSQTHHVMTAIEAIREQATSDAFALLETDEFRAEAQTLPSDGTEKPARQRFGLGLFRSRKKQVEMEAKKEEEKSTDKGKGKEGAQSFDPIDEPLPLELFPLTDLLDRGMSGLASAKHVHAKINEESQCCGGVVPPVDFEAIEARLEGFKAFYDEYLAEYVESGEAAADQRAAMRAARAAGSVNPTDPAVYRDYLLGLGGKPSLKKRVADFGR